MENLEKTSNKNLVDYQFDKRKEIQIGKYLDVYDDRDNWCLGCIKKMNDKEAFVEFDGWIEKYSESIQLSSNRFAPLRSRTRGYTGAKKVNQRKFVFDEEQIRGSISRMEKLFSVPIQPYEFTHFLRAEIFVLIDAMITSFFPSQKSVSKPTLDKVMNLFHTYVELFNKWLEQLPESFQNFAISPTFHLQNPQAAVLNAVYEFSSIWSLLLNPDNPRSELCMKAFQTTYKGELGHLSGAIIKEMQSRGCLIKISKLIKQAPVQFVIELLSPFAQGLHSNPELLGEFCKEAAAVLTKLLSEEKDFRNYSNETVNLSYQILDWIKTELEPKYLKDSTLDIILRLALKMSRSPLISIKLLGFNIISRMTDKEASQGKVNLYWNNQRNFAEKLVQYDIITIIFGESSHEEAIKNTKTILFLLLDSEKMEVGHISQIVKCCIEKHEGIGRGAIEALMELTNYLPETLFSKLLEELSKIQIKDYTEKLIDLAEHSTHCAIKRKNKKREPHKDSCNLSLFWGLIHSSSIPNKLCEKAINSLFQLQYSNPQANLIEEYLTRVGSHISEQGGNWADLKLLIKLDIATHYQFSKEKGLDLYCKKYSIIEKILELCVKDHNSKISLENLLELSRIYLDFIKYIFFNLTENYLLEKTIEGLWNCFVKSAKSPEITTLFFSILCSEMPNRKDIIGFFKTPSEASHFMIKYLCDETRFRISEINQASFLCFEKYFDYVNESSLHKGEFDSNSFLGLQNLWKIAIENEEINLVAIKTLVNFYKNCIENEIKNKRKIEESFIQICVKYSQESEKKLRRILSLLRHFIIRIEESDFSSGIDPKIFQIQPTFDFVISLPRSKKDGLPSALESKQKNQKEIHVTISQQLRTSELLEYLSNYFEIPVERIILKSENGVEIKDESISSLRLVYPKLSLEFKPELLNPIEKPRVLLVNEKKMFEILLNQTANEVVGEVWKLLEELPSSSEYVNLLQDMNVEYHEPEGWAKYLKYKNWQDFSHIAYSLFVLWRMLNEQTSSEEKINKFKTEFLDLKGFQFIIEVFHQCLYQKRSKINTRALIYSLSIMNCLLEQANVSIYFSTSDEQQIVWNHVWHLMSTLCKSRSELLSSMIMDDSEEAQLIGNCMNLHVILVTGNPKLFGKRMACEEYLNLLKEGFFCKKNPLLRYKIGEWIYTLWDAVILMATNRIEVEPFFFENLIKLYINEAISATNYSENYFNLLCQLLPSLEPRSIDCLRKPSAYLDLFVNYVIGNINKVTHKSLCGLIELLGIIIPLLEEVTIPRLDELYNSIIQALFGILPGKPYCEGFKKHAVHNPEVRSKAYILLQALIKRKNTSIHLLKQLLLFHHNPPWRTYKQSDWWIQLSQFEQSDVGYVGLENMGNTCYVNSIMQQMYLIPQFRNAILSIRGKFPKHNVLSNLQELFWMLFTKPCSNFRPKKFCDSMSVNYSVQEDVSEFLGRLFDRLESCLKETPKKNLLSNIFEISMASEIHCKACEYRSESVYSSHFLSVEVKAKKTLLESLKASVKPEILEGDNAYECSRCERKVTAEKGQCIKRLPNILIINLKRFELNYNGPSQKLNSYLEFPMEIDMEEFTQEYINKEISEIYGKIPKTYYRYKLKGILVHVGQMESGHYYSYIKDNERKIPDEKEKWFEFNDILVRHFDIKDIPEAAFGQSENSTGSYSIFPHHIMAKSNNAYLLFYEREGQVDPDGWQKCVKEKGNLDIVELNKQISLAQKKSVPEPIISTDLTKRMEAEQEENLIKQFVFHPAYSKFVITLLDEIMKVIGTLENADIIQIQQFALTYFFTTALRGESMDANHEVLRFLKKCCSQHRGLCRAIAIMFSTPLIIKEFIVNCPKEHARRNTVSLLREVMNNLYANENAEISTFIDNFHFLGITKMEELAHSKVQDSKNCVPINLAHHKVPYLILMIDGFLQEIYSLSKANCGQYFQVLAHFAKLDKSCKKYLITTMMIGLAGEYLSLDPTKESEKISKERFPHFKWTEKLFIQSISYDVAPADECRSNVMIHQQSKFILELVNELLPYSYSMRNDLLTLDKAIFDSLQHSLQTWSQKASLQLLFKTAEYSKLSLNYLGLILKSICENTKEEEKNYIESLLNYKLASGQFTELKQYLKVINCILTTQKVSLFQEMFSQIIKTLIELFAKPTPIAIGVSYIDFVIDLCHKNKRIRAEFEKSKSAASKIISVMIKWTEDNKAPVPSTLIDRNCMKVWSSVWEDLAKIYKSNSETRLLTLKCIRDNKLSNPLESDKHPYIDPNSIKLGQQMEIFLPSVNQWVEAKVDFFDDNIIKFSCASSKDNMQEVCLNLDSDSIDPRNSKIESQRRTEYEYFEVLLGQ